jgi:hypothetical protein
MCTRLNFWDLHHHNLLLSLWLLGNKMSKCTERIRLRLVNFKHVSMYLLFLKLKFHISLIRAKKERKNDKLRLL